MEPLWDLCNQKHLPLPLGPRDKSRLSFCTLPAGLTGEQPPSGCVMKGWNRNTPTEGWVVCILTPQNTEEDLEKLYAGYFPVARWRPRLYRPKGRIASLAPRPPIAAAGHFAGKRTGAFGKSGGPYRRRCGLPVSAGSAGSDARRENYKKSYRIFIFLWLFFHRSATINIQLHGFRGRELELVFPESGGNPL